eukprot:11992903-Alexandrium_andersonii.AAC.1
MTARASPRVIQLTTGPAQCSATLAWATTARTCRSQRTRTARTIQAKATTSRSTAQPSTSARQRSTTLTTRSPTPLQAARASTTQPLPTRTART